jgi:mannose-6-phosphate isomerase-like protein (cupin superfamily)
MILVPPGGGEVIGDAPDRRVEILCELDAVHATWSRFAPGRDGADLHVHRLHTDVFYVLAGSLGLKLAGGEAVAGAGTFVRVPPMVAHGFRNGGADELRYLNFHAPGTGFAAYMRGLGRGERVPFDQEPPPDEGVRPSSEIEIARDGVSVGDLRIAETSSPDGALAAYVLEGDGAGTWVTEPTNPVAGTRFVAIMDRRGGS